VDRDPRLHEAPARLVNVVHLVGEMAEIAAAAVAVLVPIVGKLHLAALVAGDSEEDEREAAGLIVHPPPLLEPKQVEEADGRFGIADPKHRVKEAHARYLGGGDPNFTVGVTPSISTAL